MSATTVTADDLRRVRARIEDPQRWTTGWYARNRDGERVDPTDRTAVCWCVIGACMVEGVPGAEAPLYAAALMANDMGLTSLNDDLGHAAVLAVLDRAIADVEQREAGS